MNSIQQFENVSYIILKQQEQYQKFKINIMERKAYLTKEVKTKNNLFQS